jgi:two-component system cell cycle sensor histidine kinase PleC
MFAWIVDELVANAVEHSPSGERIVIEVTRNDHGGVVLEARNKSQVIEPDKLKLLTQPFVQGDSGHAREHEGVGLGLFIVERYVRLHGGSLELECSAGGDFTARIRLPGAIGRRSLTATAA